MFNTIFIIRQGPGIYDLHIDDEYQATFFQLKTALESVQKKYLPEGDIKNG